jgi:hypothetical protein
MFEYNISELLSTSQMYKNQCCNPVDEDKEV